MNITHHDRSWKMGPQYDPVEWTQSTLSVGNDPPHAPTAEQLQRMMRMAQRSAMEFIPLTGGASHFVYKVTGAESEEPCVLKATTKELRNCLGGAVYWQGWLETRISVPAMLFHDLTLSELPFAFVVFQFLNAHDLITCVDSLSTDELDSIAANVVEANRAILDIPPCLGFGGAKSHFDKGMFFSWRDFLFTTFKDTAMELERSKEFQSLSKQLEQKLDILGPTISRTEPRPFLEDATLRNVLVSNGKFAGIVDLDEVSFGDPLWPIAATHIEAVCGRHNLKYISALLCNYNPNYDRDLYELYLELLLARKLCIAIKNRANLGFFQQNREILLSQIG